MTAPRHEFSRKTKAAAWARCEGRCEGLLVSPGRTRNTAKVYRCDALLRGRFVYDHIDPDWYSKDNELENCQVLCEQCNRDKTAKDQGAIAKSKRIIDKRTKALTSKRPMPGGKRDWRKKKIGGGVVDRRTGLPITPNTRSPYR